MSEISLAKVEHYGSNVALALHAYSTLSKYNWASNQTAATFKPLLQEFGGYLQEIGTVEETISVPAFRNLRHVLQILIETGPVLSAHQLLPLQTQLARSSEQLKQIISRHTSTLSSIKRLGLTSHKAASHLLSQAQQLHEQGQNRMSHGYATSFLGGALLVPTFGASLSIIKGGDNKYNAGESMLHECEQIRAEVGVAFSKFSTLLQSGIDVVQGMAGVLTILEVDVRTLSTSQKPHQLRIIRPKATHVSRTLARYISVTDAVFGAASFYPYARNAFLLCNGCRNTIDQVGMFYHCNESTDMCPKCYPSHRHRQKSNGWTKHSKAQFMIHVYRTCNGCHGVIDGGKARFCGTCDFDLCQRCSNSPHTHPLHSVEVRWYGDFKQHEVVCDECWHPAKEIDNMYQCLECYLVFCLPQLQEGHGSSAWITSISDWMRRIEYNMSTKYIVSIFIFLNIILTDSYNVLKRELSHEC